MTGLARARGHEVVLTGRDKDRIEARAAPAPSWQGATSENTGRIRAMSHVVRWDAGAALGVHLLRARATSAGLGA